MSSTDKDLLTELERPGQLTPPDRVSYDEGVLLDALDFRAEQSYHRGRLARVLAYLFGTGTAAGLEVGLGEAARSPATRVPRGEGGAPAAQARGSPSTGWGGSSRCRATGASASTAGTAPASPPSSPPRSTAGQRWWRTSSSAS